MPDQTVYPCVYVVSDDYMAPDTGEAGGYDDSIRLLFPDLDFGTPDQVKRLLWVEVVYQSLREIPITITTWYRKSLGESGSASDTVTYETSAVAANEPGVFFGTSSPVWGTASYATLRTFSIRGDLEKVTGRSFDVGVIADCNLTPMKIVKVALCVAPLTRGPQGVVYMGEVPS